MSQITEERPLFLHDCGAQYYKRNILASREDLAMVERKIPGLRESGKKDRGKKTKIVHGRNSSYIEVKTWKKGSP